MLDKIKKFFCGTQRPLNTNQPEQDSIQDQAFTIDFLWTSDLGETIKNVQVVFPDDKDCEETLIINDETNYFDAFKVDNLGMSKDNKYHKVGTSDFIFWIRSKDFKRFMSVVNSRHNALMEKRKAKYSSLNDKVKKPFEYDPIDDEIYKCFIAGKSRMSSEAERHYQIAFDKSEEEIARICSNNGGKYYKSEAKTAKFAIVFAVHHRMAEAVDKLRDKGYKVTTYEKAIEHFGLTNIPNMQKLLKKLNEDEVSYKKDITDRWDRFKNS